MEPSSAVITLLITVACVSAGVVQHKDYKIGANSINTPIREDWEYDEDLAFLKSINPNPEDLVKDDDSVKSYSEVKTSTEKPGSRFGLSADVDDDEDRFPIPVTEDPTVRIFHGSQGSYRMAVGAPADKYPISYFGRLPRSTRSVENTFPAQSPFHIVKPAPTEGEESPVEFPSLLAVFKPKLTEIDGPVDLAVTASTLVTDDGPVKFPSHVTKVTPAEVEEAPEESPAHLAVTAPKLVTDDSPVEFPSNVTKMTPAEFQEATTEFPAHLAVETPTSDKVPVEFPSNVTKMTPAEVKEAPDDIPAHLAVTEPKLVTVDSPVEFPSNVTKITPAEVEKAPDGFPAHLAAVGPAPVVDGLPVVLPDHLAIASRPADAEGVKAVTPTDTNNISKVNVHANVADLDDLSLVVHDDGPGQVFKMVFNKNDSIIAQLKDPIVFKDYIRVSVDLANVLPEMIEQTDVLIKRCLHISWESENVLVVVKSPPMANGECLRYTAPMSVAEELNYTRQRLANRQSKH